MNRKRGLRNEEGRIHLRSQLLSKSDSRGARAALRGRCVRKLFRWNRNEAANQPGRGSLDEGNLRHRHGGGRAAQQAGRRHTRPDVAISMGCNVSCPFVGRPFDSGTRRPVLNCLPFLQRTPIAGQAVNRSCYRSLLRQETGSLSKDYPAEFKRHFADRCKEGASITVLQHEFGLSKFTVKLWRKRIDQNGATVRRGYQITLFCMRSD